jgi:SurA N-terminal domain
MTRLLRLFLFFALPLSFALGETPVFLPQEEPQDIVIYNRIVAKVNGKTISVIDVMKKMDLFLQRYYPEHAQSKFARFQYYSKQWRDTLSQIIDQELMLADAEHLELKITDAEVREEVLGRFGPNIMATLDTLGMTYDEARTQIYNDMVVQRIMWYRVHSKALTNVNPQDIKVAYKTYSLKNPPMEKWRYQVLSIRSLQRDLGEVMAKKAFDLLNNKRVSWDLLPEQLKSDEDTIAVTLSPELEGDDRGLSGSHKDVLKNLTPGTFSSPIAQVSRADNSVVYRIFFLKEHQRQETPAFEKMAEELKDELMQHAVSKETMQYLTKLRERLGYDEKQMLEVLPSDFQPFAIR